MGSTLLELRNLLGEQIDYTDLTASSNPSTTLLNNYINKAYLRVVRRNRPRELETSDDLAVTVNTNTVAIPTDFYVPIVMNYQNKSNGWDVIKEMTYKNMVGKWGPKRLEQSTNTGSPLNYAIYGTNFIYNKYFDQSRADGVRLYYVKRPTALANETDEIALPLDYDLQIVYTAASFFYQKDDDFANQRKYEDLAEKERLDLKDDLSRGFDSVMELDGTYFHNASERNFLADIINGY